MDTKKIELIANIALIVIGLVLGIVFYGTETKNEVLSLIGFSIALASILYQFLGGITNEDNTFSLGAIKFGGSAAILIGFMFFFKKVIFVANTTPQTIVVDPATNWIPVDLKTGEVTPVTVTNGTDTLRYPQGDIYTEDRKKIAYKLTEKENSIFSIVLNRNATDTLGYVNLHDFETSSLYNQFNNADGAIIQVFKLYPYRENECSSKQISDVDLPFEIKVSNCSFTIPGYLNHKTTVVSKTSWLVPVSKEYVYVVFLEQANCTLDPKTENFSKWIVKKFKKELID